MKFIKNKIYIIAGIFGLMILSLVLFGILPLMADINSNSKNLLSEKSDTAVLKLQSDEIDNFKKSYTEYQPNLEKINQLFVDPQNPVDFIKFLESTAVAASVKSQISLGITQDQRTMVFNITSDGDFLNVLHFIQSLESGPYLIEIQNVSFRNADINNTAKNYPSGIINAVFSINAFTK